jgi:hypothetical protein
MRMEETLTPDPNFDRPVKDLAYKDLLTISFTQASHDRGIKTWCSSLEHLDKDDVPRLNFVVYESRKREWTLFIINRSLKTRPIYVLFII